MYLPVQFFSGLMADGVLPAVMRYPTVPRGTARLRITVTAAHQPEQIEALGKRLADLPRSAY